MVTNSSRLIAVRRCLNRQLAGDNPKNGTTHINVAAPHSPKLRRNMSEKSFRKHMPSHLMVCVCVCSHTKGRLPLPKQMNFRKSSKGGVGVIFNPKIYVADFCHYRRYFGHEFQKKLQYNFPKMSGGGGAKAVWNFSENSSVLEGECVP